MATQGKTAEAEGHPRKRAGEPFGEYWQRISDDAAHAITAASRMIGVTPQSIWQSYIRFEDE
jgi:hypothetical protein